MHAGIIEIEKYEIIVSMFYRNRMQTTNHYFGNKHTQGLKMAISI